MTDLEIRSQLSRDQAHQWAFYRQVNGDQEIGFVGICFLSLETDRSPSNGAPPVLVAVSELVRRIKPQVWWHCKTSSHQPVLHCIGATSAATPLALLYNWFSRFNPSQTSQRSMSQNAQSGTWRLEISFFLWESSSSTFEGAPSLSAGSRMHVARCPYSIFLVLNDWF